MNSSSSKLFDLSNRTFTVNGVTLLSNVPTNVFFTPFSVNVSSSDATLDLKQSVLLASNKGGFLGFKQQHDSNVLYQSLGEFKDRNFLSIFRFKTWWSTQWIGKNGSDLQKETQWVMFDVHELKSYVVIIPIIEASFRSCLIPSNVNSNNGEVTLFVESGSKDTKASAFDSIAYVHFGDNPYNLMNEAYGAIRVHMNTFKLLSEKKVPKLVNKFGWCTWDAFYLTVEPSGIWQGLMDFKQGGVSPRFLIIDDGWQSITIDNDDDDEMGNEDCKGLVFCGTQMTARLHSLEECKKFKKYEEGSMLSPDCPRFDSGKTKLIFAKAKELENAAIGSNHAEKCRYELLQMLGQIDPETTSFEGSGFKGFIKDLKQGFKGLDDVYVWHALCGAWGGVKPGAMTHLNAEVVQCEVSEGLSQTMDDLAVIKLVEGGVGLVHPSQAVEFYEAMHSYLASVGITGVKVDVIESLEYLGQQYGGRVELAKAYYNALTKSVIKNFNGSGLISSMQQCNDFLYLGTKQISMGRVGDDFWLGDSNDPMGMYWLQGVHMIHCAYNSLWIGQIIQPDWDMFQTDHVCALYHAASRAISGGPIYVSDSVGCHNFDVLKQLVFRDGTVPKCEHFALPTRDCLFKNPLFDQQTLLKIWNLNKYGGVVGAFNTQGAGWDPKLRKIRGYPECYKPVTGTVHFIDIEWDQIPNTAKFANAESYALYLNQAKKLHIVTNKTPPFTILMQPSSFELFSFVPIQSVDRSTVFAPIGLTNMLNSNGAVVEVEYGDQFVKIKVKGEGEFLSYSNNVPKMVKVDGMDVEFEFCDREVKIGLKWVEENDGISTIEFHF